MDLDRRARALVSPDVEQIREPDLSPAHQNDIAARAADLHGDEIGRTDRFAEELQRAPTRRGTGQQQRHRTVAQLRHGHHAAIALDEQHRRAQSQLTQACIEGTKIGKRSRRDIGVQNSRRGALVLADDRRDFTRHRYEATGEVLHRLGRRVFMPGVREAVEQADGDRLDALFAKDLQRRADILVRQRFAFLARPVDPTAHRKPQLARNEDGGIGRSVIPWVVTRATADVQRIAEARGRQHGDACPLAFEHGIGGDRGAVHEERAGSEEAADRQVFAVRRALQGVQHALAGVRGNRRNLEDPDAAIRPDQDEIGEGAADIDADTPGGGCRLHHAASLGDCGRAVAISALAALSAATLFLIHRDVMR
jgi:hypothetical protein